MRPEEIIIPESGNYKFISCGVKKNVWAEVDDNKIVLSFPYDEYIKDEVKALGARFDWDDKTWTLPNNRHSQFQLKRLLGQNPYARWQKTPEEYPFRIPIYNEETKQGLFPQQVEMARQGLTYRQMIWAAEMGLGKTLSAFMVIENAVTKDDYLSKEYDLLDKKNLDNLDNLETWWIAPRPGIASFEVEIAKWGLLRNYPSQIMTYEGLVSLLKSWPKGTKIPQIIIFDEFSRARNEGSQRSKACYAICEAMRDEFGYDDCYMIGMTGTPAPKSPMDYYNECETIAPGFLREGNKYKFQERLAFVRKEQNESTGGFYPKLIGWRDGTPRCNTCGTLKEHHGMTDESLTHNFIQADNEVAKLYRRMKGLVSVYFKKDWMKFLPDKRYRILRAKPSRALINAAMMVKASATTAISALTLLRELSDGFQYAEQPSGNFTTCELCNGTCKVEVPDYNGEELSESEDLKMIEITCTNCDGTGKVESINRVTNEAGSGKDELLKEILEDHDDDGRLIIYAGFTGSIDRIVGIVQSEGWDYIRVDGRGWRSSVEGWKSTKDMLLGFQDKSRRVPKLVYVAHAASGGLAVTLTEAFEEVYFSNSFNAEDRQQSEDRAHRPGMDVNRGLLITDLVNLESDLYVLANIQAKKRLQDMSLGQFHDSLNLEASV